MLDPGSMFEDLILRDEFFLLILDIFIWKKKTKSKIYHWLFDCIGNGRVLNTNSLDFMSYLRNYPRNYLFVILFPEVSKSSRTPQPGESQHFYKNQYFRFLNYRNS